MKEKIKLSLLSWKIFFPVAIILISCLMIIFRADLKLFFWNLGIISNITFIRLFYLTLRLKIIFDYENKEIIYYGHIKHIIHFDEIDLSGITAHAYAYIKKKDGRIVKINTNFMGRKITVEEIQKEIIQKINEIIRK